MKTINKITITSSDIKLFEQILNEENGVLDFVCNENDIFTILTIFLPSVKNNIIRRKNKIVIHIDSKEPLDIICGTTKVYGESAIDDEIGSIIVNGKHYRDNGCTHCHRWEPYHIIDENPSPQNKGVIELLWDIFGGSIDEKGDKVINKNISLNYDKSISNEKINNIQQRLLAKHFSVSNITYDKETNITIKQLQETLDTLIKNGIDVNSEVLFNLSDKNEKFDFMDVYNLNISNSNKNVIFNLALNMEKNRY